MVHYTNTIVKKADLVILPVGLFFVFETILFIYTHNKKKKNVYKMAVAKVFLHQDADLPLSDLSVLQLAWRHHILG